MALAGSGAGPAAVAIVAALLALSRFLAVPIPKLTERWFAIVVGILGLGASLVWGHAGLAAYGAAATGLLLMAVVAVADQRGPRGRSDAVVLSSIGMLALIASYQLATQALPGANHVAF